MTEFINRKIAALRAGISKSYIDRLIKRGLLPVYQPGGPNGKVFIDPAELEQVIRDSKRGADSRRGQRQRSANWLDQASLARRRDSE